MHLPFYQELCRVLFDALEKVFKGTQQENLINELYQGEMKDYVKCSVTLFLEKKLQILKLFFSKGM